MGYLIIKTDSHSQPLPSGRSYQTEAAAEEVFETGDTVLFEDGESWENITADFELNCAERAEWIRQHADHIAAERHNLRHAA